jgi:hybrid cluster-associated redox disulfide protein
MKKITKKMTFTELLEAKPKAAEILFEAGMHCIGCPMSSGESIEEGCLGHGFTKKEVDELIKKLERVDDKEEKTKILGEDILLELEDMIYGFENYKELRPNEKRIDALKAIRKKIPNKAIEETLKIFESGHGVLSTPARTKALKKVLEELR